MNSILYLLLSLNLKLLNICTCVFSTAPLVGVYYNNNNNNNNNNTDDVPVFSVHFDARADSVYQALFSGLGTRLVFI